MKKNVTKKAEKKVIREEYRQSQVPDEVKIALGKFYIFAMVYAIFFGVIFPFFLIERISLVSQILSVIVLILFYIYMFIDVKKKKQKFTSTLFVLLIVLDVVLISISIVKMFI